MRDESLTSDCCPEFLHSLRSPLRKYAGKKSQYYSHIRTLASSPPMQERPVQRGEEELWEFAYYAKYYLLSFSFSFSLKTVVVVAAWNLKHTTGNAPESSACVSVCDMSVPTVSVS